MASVPATTLKWSASREISVNLTLKNVPSIFGAQTFICGYRSNASRHLDEAGPRFATGVGVNEDKDVRLAVTEAGLKLVREHQVVRTLQNIECGIEGKLGSGSE